MTVQNSEVTLPPLGVGWGSPFHLQMDLLHELRIANEIMEHWFRVIWLRKTCSVPPCPPQIPPRLFNLIYDNFMGWGETESTWYVDH
jgi:hypothetical protein